MHARAFPKVLSRKESEDSGLKPVHRLIITPKQDTLWLHYELLEWLDHVSRFATRAVFVADTNVVIVSSTPKMFLKKFRNI